MLRSLKILLTLIIASIFLGLSACSPITRQTDAAPKLPEETLIIPRDTRLIGERKIGVFVPEAAWKAAQNVLPLEAELNVTFDIVHWFTHWRAPFEAQPIQKAFALGRAPLITWETDTVSLDDINNGSQDAYIRSWAQGYAELGGEVYIRLFPEMNGDWTPWHGDSGKLKQAWIRIVTLFREEGATNAKWVWSPNVTDEPRTRANQMENYYPGDAYVDLMGIDGYNWGSTRNWSTWTPFEQLFVQAYNRLSTLANKPIWIVETASTEHGGNKAMWIDEMLSSNAFPRVEAVIWFNEEKETDWRLESSQSSAAAFKNWFANRKLASN